MRYTLDTPIAELEFSTRTANVLINHGCQTLRQAAEKLDYVKQHAKGFGHKSYREVKEAIQYASQEQGDLLQDTEYRRYLLEDRLGTIQALMQDCSRILLRAALKGHIGKDARRDVAFKLRDAAVYAEQLPTQMGD